MNDLTAKDITEMFLGGAALLARYADRVDGLNVFPVPDGDTGTNMNLTMSSGVSELKRQASDHAGKAAQAFSKGLMMGARGNSGVILSQLFRGFGKALAESERISGEQLARAFSNGVSTAYEAVMKPVEGTILTVAKEAAAGAIQSAREPSDVLTVMQDTLEAARNALARTPDMLPVLKEVGVVDSGGQGLVYIYEGFVQALMGWQPEAGEEPSFPPALEGGFQAARAQAHMKTEDIEYGYCTEFMIRLDEKKPFQQRPFREEISRFGDSLLVAADDDLVKIHIHSERPGEVLSFGQNYGELTGIKIENMRQQHLQILQEEESDDLPPVPEKVKQPIGVVAVSIGEGIAAILKSLGVDEIVAGGQSMNPSTEDLVKAASKIRAGHIFFLPNNKNVQMAAEQAAQLLEVPATVIPSRSIPQGMSAMVKFNRNASADQNKQEMAAAIAKVKTAQVTYAVRDTKMDHMDIKEGDTLGLLEGEIVEAGSSVTEVARSLVSRLVGEEDEILAIFYGKDVSAEQAEELADLLQEDFSDLEIELHEGGQPLYSYIFSAE